MTPTGVPASTTCGQSELYAETTTTFTYPLDCSAGTLLPVPIVRLAVRSILQVAGGQSKNARLFATINQSVIRIRQLTITGVRPGTVTVVTRGLSCASMGATQPASCPLMRVLVI
jgi:hypothetical protein